MSVSLLKIFNTSYGVIYKRRKKIISQTRSGPGTIRQNRLYIWMKLSGELCDQRALLPGKGWPINGNPDKNLEPPCTFDRSPAWKLWWGENPCVTENWTPPVQSIAIHFIVDPGLKPFGKEVQLCVYILIILVPFRHLRPDNTSTRTWALPDHFQFIYHPLIRCYIA
jgi:hypothetical protein